MLYYNVTVNYYSNYKLDFRIGNDFIDELLYWIKLICFFIYRFLVKNF